MDLTIYKGMDANQRLKYIEFLLWHYRVVDSFWFISVEETHGRRSAEEMNERVWERTGPMAARDLVKRFEIREKGLEGLEKALKLFPFTNIGEHQIDRTEEAIILEVPHCPAQEARTKRGLGEYDCKEMHRRAFANFAREVDPAIFVTCDFAPPDPHPKNLFCKWRFSLSSEGDGAEGGD